MPWAVILHVLFISIWVAGQTLVVGLCYERRHAAEEEHPRLVAMTVRLFAWVATLSAVLAVITGMWLMYRRGFDGGWLPVKLALVSLLVGLHLLLGRMVSQLRRGDGPRRGSAHLLIALGPPLLAIPIVYLVTAKPF